MMAPSDWRDGSLRPSLPMTKPFFKWAGGKGQLLNRLLQFIPRPDDGHAYFEPFLGAGALFFFLRPRRAVLDDVNRPLIDTYKVARNRYHDLVRVLTELAAMPDSDEYHARRKEFNAFAPEVSDLYSV